MLLEYLHVKLHTEFPYRNVLMSFHLVRNKGRQLIKSLNMTLRLAYVPYTTRTPSLLFVILNCPFINKTIASCHQWNWNMISQITNNYRQWFITPNHSIPQTQMKSFDIAQFPNYRLPLIHMDRVANLSIPIVFYEAFHLMQIISLGQVSRNDGEGLISVERP